jgi:hypothetical protein
MYVKFLHVRPRDISEHTYALLAQDLRNDQILDLYLAQQNDLLETDFHETYHFWQGLRLPYLHRYAVLTFLAMRGVFRDLALSGIDWRRWHEVTEHRLKLLGEPRYVILHEGFLYYFSTAVHETAVALSAIDLLETAASLAEFQVRSLQADRTDGNAFDRWTKKRPTYRSALNLVERVVGDTQVALRCTLPAINAAFHTTDPVRTFAILINNVALRIACEPTWNDFIAQPEPCAWRSFFESLLDNIEFDEDGDVLDILDESYARLNLAQWQTIKTPWNSLYGGAHPFISHKSLQWSERQEKNPLFAGLLDQPGWAGREHIEEALKLFEPVTIMRFHAGGGLDRVIRIGGPDDNAALVKALLAMHGTIRRATSTHFDPNSRLCPHSNCPEHELNYCNCFIKVPADFHKCEFPTWMSGTIAAIQNEYGGTHGQKR